MDAPTLRSAVAEHLQYTRGKDEHTATALDRFFAVAAAVRDRMVKRWIDTQQEYYRADAKRVYYLSLEFLLGRTLGSNLLNLGMYDAMRDALADLGIELADLLEQEPDAGLGNGGLGRLAACFLDSMATLALPAYGYGIRYEFGIFDQDIRGGEQVELPEQWLRFENAWEISRPEYMVPVNFGGRTERRASGEVAWVDTRHVLGMPYDTPIAGYRNDSVNTLRLWRARAARELNLDDFHAGDYLAAVAEKNLSENISKVLYPNDVTMMGKELRLQQQYFFVACSVADILRRYQKAHTDLRSLPDKVAIHLNDTHPSLAVAELLRLLVDEHRLPFREAWELTRRTFSYTNHTLMPEALEKWPVELLARTVPRHLELIYDVNELLLAEVRARHPGDEQRVKRTSIVEEHPHRSIRMANLAVVGSHAVNGVAELHSELLKRELFPDFFELWPERFNSKTNGISPRRWLLLANPGLTRLVEESLGDRSWAEDLTRLRRLEPLADDASFRERFARVKRENKIALGAAIAAEHGLIVDPDSVFDVQVKRIHEYKRQLLNVLHVLALYNRIKADPRRDVVSRTFIFGGKAAPAYRMAKRIIKLIHAVAARVNDDPDVAARVRVFFLKNYRVSLAERIVPAADLSEQISTAGTEASGTSNMKFSLNGALTIGTLDGANIEILREVGAENFFAFGKTVDEVAFLRARGHHPWALVEGNAELRGVLDTLRGLGDFGDILDSLLSGGDHFLVLADFADYLAAQERVAQAWLDPQRWRKMAVLNTARVGGFSSDRTVKLYADEIWRVRPVPVPRLG